MVCSYIGAEASGQDWGVTLAIPKSSSPLQAIEKRKLKSVPIWTLAGPFSEGQAFGGNGKLLGLLRGKQAKTSQHFHAEGGI
jgi:hypothetical protein